MNRGFSFRIRVKRIMRYFLHLAYHGKPFVGWQRQPNGLSVQQCLEDCCSTLLQSPIQIVGCGRTDTGVHASDFYAHIDVEAPPPENFISRLNKMLPDAIGVYAIIPVQSDQHARFDATARTYHYWVGGRKDPMLSDRCYFYYYYDRIDFDLLQEAAQALTSYHDFFTFSKSRTDVKTFECDILRSQWYREDQNLLRFEISANRFLRGMVRLIVGMCLHVSIGRLELDVVKEALETQSVYPNRWSAPAHGLTLTRVEYPFLPKA